MGMAARKIEPQSEAVRQADELLRDIAEATAALKKLNVECTDEMNELATRYKAGIAELKAHVELLEKQLTKLMKKNRVELFGEGDGEKAFDRDRLDLKYGALLLAIERRVKRAKDVLARLEEISAEEAIIIEKSVNWEVLERWTDERLIEVGTERVIKEKYSYEVFAREAPVQNPAGAGCKGAEKGVSSGAKESFV